MAAVAYILTWVTGLVVFFLAKKEDKWTRWHAIQAIGLGIAATIVSIVLSMFTSAMFWGGGFGTGMGFAMLSNLWWLLVLILVIILAVKAYQGGAVRLPLVADFADKNA